MEFSKEKLEKVANNSLYTTFTNSATIEHSFKIFKRFLKPGKILELGPAEGLMTVHLNELDASLTVIEGSNVFARELKCKFPTINVINELFENATLDAKFDNIILGHVLEHVDNPLLILELIKKWLNPGGIVLCAVPNARSIHRQAAVEMNMLKSIFSMSDKDVHHGHLRIYTPELLREDFIEAGYNIIHTGGYWLKPISDKQIEQQWNIEMLEAFMRLGEFYPDIAGEIYLIGSIK
jgi:2-polyprenyl-3-methyl-5-hydroxy-6-metoxy-1,4-benzoquinol methylase